MFDYSLTLNDGYFVPNGGLSDGMCDLFLDLKCFGEVFNFMMNFLV